jgi:type II secretory pathway predicted ATPase ExeA
VNTAGFVLIDSLFRPVYADPESIKILGFPNAVSNPASLDGILAKKILSILAPDIVVSQRAATTQFQSGRRHYLCRAFFVENHWKGSFRETKIALLLEREMPGPPACVENHLRLGGMSEDPFCFAPAVKFYHFSRAHKEVLASLRDMIREARGIGVLFGQAGMGKTILLDYLAESLREESEIAVFPGALDGRAELVRTVMAALGVNGLGRELSANLRHFQQWLLSKNRAGRRVTLICDGAQDFTLETLENLCLFSDLETGRQKLLQIVLAGRLGLLEKLTGPGLEAISNKINVFCRLAPMDEAEVRSYVLHRLRIAGCTRQLFSSAALSAIALYSRGIPLNVNLICRHSLSLASAINLQVVDERVVADSAYDLVLASPPANIWDGSSGRFFTEAHPRPGLSHDRRGLRLVPKPGTPS